MEKIGNSRAGSNGKREKGEIGKRRFGKDGVVKMECPEKVTGGDLKDVGGTRQMRWHG